MCINGIDLTRGQDMTYLEAKIELMEKHPPLPFVGMAIEAVVLVGIAALLVMTIA